MDRIYLDNAATTRLSQRALAAMLPYMEGEQGNPSSLHGYAREARKALERARGQLARCIVADESEIVFTSGGSEGNNYLLRGVIDAYQDRGNHVITSAVEHPAVMNTLISLEKQGWAACRRACARPPSAAVFREKGNPRSPFPTSLPAAAAA